jgi:hypothetical protein
MVATLAYVGEDFLRQARMGVGLADDAEDLSAAWALIRGAHLVPREKAGGVVVGLKCGAVYVNGGIAETEHLSACEARDGDGAGAWGKVTG